MTLELRALGIADVEDHNAGEDEATVRWLTGGYGTVESTTAHFIQLARNAEAAQGARGFGLWLDDRLAGYVEGNPDVSDGLEAGDVNVAYAVHPWARGRGLAVEAANMMCDYIRDHRIGSRAALRIEPQNYASLRVAEKGGFTRVRDFVSTTDTHPDGAPAVLSLWLREV